MGSARLGVERPGQADATRQGLEGQGKEGQAKAGKAWKGGASPGWAWRGRRGWARRGVARKGQARRGRQGDNKRVLMMDTERLKTQFNKDVREMSVGELMNEVATLRVEVVRRGCVEMNLQSRIDALMFEYCPDEMTPEQITKYKNSQKPI